MPNEAQGKMKDSGVEWVGQIPEDWDISPLKHNFEIVSGATPDSSNFLLWDGDVLWITPADFKTSDYYVAGGHRNISELGYKSCSTTIIPANSVIFSKRAPIGSVAINTTELCTNQGCLSCIPKGGTYTKYFAYMMGIYDDVFNFFGSGTTFKEISSTVFGDMKFPKPSYIIQKNIADFLDSKCAEIDSLRFDIEKEIETLEEYKKSVITEAVTKGLDPDVPMKDSGIPWIGTIPSHWPIYRIADLYEDRNERGNDELPLLSVSINSGVSDKELSDDEQERVFLRSEDKTKYKRVYPGDITYNMMRAWQGAFGAVRVGGMVSPAYVVAKKTGIAEIDSRYIEALLRSPSGIEEMNRYSYGIMDFRKRLYWPQFRIINVCLPPIEEQRRISDYIDAKAEEINTCIELQKMMLGILDDYKKSIIYEYVTGKKAV